MLYKLARRDFQVLIPTAGPGVPLVYRVVVKLYAEFSGNPHFRHPFELGGAVWIAYSQFYVGEDRIDDTPLFIALAVLVGTWTTALGTFFLSINRTHLNTFVSTETGPQFLRRRFEHFSGNDEQRMEIFMNRPSMCASFADVVQAWVAQRYTTMSVQPWFTPEVKALVPNAFFLLVPLP